MNYKTVSLIVMVWMIISSLYLTSISLDAGTTSVIDSGLFKASIVDVIVFSAFSIVLYYLIKKPIINSNMRLVAILFVAIYAIWQPFLLIFNGYNTPFFRGDELPSLSQVFSMTPYIYVYSYFIQYLFIFCFCAGLIYYQYIYKIQLKALALEQKNIETELKFSDTKMRALLAQLSPHFLFNSLNSISGLIRDSQNNTALDTVASLGNLLRFSLNASKCALISLTEEIEFTNHYVALQKLRFKDSFSFKLNLPAEDQSLKCPPFILQTLIENAFTHANFEDEVTRKIILDISIEKDKLHIICSNSANQNSNCKGETEGLGIALQNLRDRLNLIYENDFDMTTNAMARQFHVEVKIPIQTTKTFS